MRKMIALLATVALMLFGGAATALADSHAPPQDGVVEEDAGEDGAGFVAELLAGLTALFGSSAA